MNEDYRKSILYWMRKLSSEEHFLFWRLSGTQLNSVRVSLSGHRQLSPIICSVIEKMSGGEFTRQEMRPADYHIIWPELVKNDNGGSDGCHAN